MRPWARRLQTESDGDGPGAALHAPPNPEMCRIRSTSQPGRTFRHQQSILYTHQAALFQQPEPASLPTRRGPEEEEGEDDNLLYLALYRDKVTQTYGMRDREERGANRRGERAGRRANAGNAGQRQRHVLRAQRPGVRVERGPDWNGGNQDGGSWGTTLARKALSGWIYVRWQAGGESKCRVGADGKYDLLVCEAEAKGTALPLPQPPNIGGGVCDVEAKGGAGGAVGSGAPAFTSEDPAAAAAVTSASVASPEKVVELAPEAEFNLMLSQLQGLRMRKDMPVVGASDAQAIGATAAVSAPADSWSESGPAQLAVPRSPRLGLSNPGATMASEASGGDNGGALASVTTSCGPGRWTHRGPQSARPAAAPFVHVATVQSHAPGFAGSAASASATDDHLEAKRIGQLFDEWRSLRAVEAGDNPEASVLSPGAPSGLKRSNGAQQHYHVAGSVASPANPRFSRVAASSTAPSSPSPGEPSPCGRSPEPSLREDGPRAASPAPTSPRNEDGLPKLPSKGPAARPCGGRTGVGGEVGEASNSRAEIERRRAERLFNVAVNPKVRCETWSDRGPSESLRERDYIEGFPTLSLLRLYQVRMRA